MTLNETNSEALVAPAGSGAANADGVGIAGADGSGAMFDAIAERYDRLNRILSLGLDNGWRRKAVAAMGLSGAEESTKSKPRMLDLATGTGDLALEVAASTYGSEVVGLDPSEGMLEEGRKKVRQQGLEHRIELRSGSAESLPFEDHSFDAVGIAFGIRNVGDRSKALREMARVTKADGRVVVLELSEPRGILGIGAKFYLHQLVPRIGALLSGRKEYRYLQKSIAAFPPADEFARQMESCGLEMVSLVPLTFGVSHMYVAKPSAAIEDTADAGARFDD